MRTSLFFLSLCLLSLLGCGDEEDGQSVESIEQVWQLCERSLPDAMAKAEELKSSLHLTDEKDAASPPSEYVRQRYNLLAIRLRDKLDIVPASPDSALQAVAYFDGRQDAVDKERAYYYLASAYRDLKDYPRAVSLFLKAADVAEHSGSADTLIWQNALSQLRNLYMLQLNYEEELNVALQSVALARQSGKNLGCYLMDAASAYKHLNDTTQCLLYLDQAYSAINSGEDAAKYGRILSAMLAAYSDFNDYEKVNSLLATACSLPEDKRPQNYELCLAKCYEHKNLTDSAIIHYKAHYNNINNVAGRYEAAAGLQRQYLQRGDYREAALWGQCLYATNDTIIRERAFEQTQRARDEYRYLRDKEAEQAIMQRDERIIFYSVIAGLALLSIVLGLVAFHIFKKKRLAEQLSDRERLLEQKDRVNKELTRIALMNVATDKASEVLAHFQSIAAGRTRLTEASWKGLTAAIETLYPGFLDTVQEREGKPMHEPLLQTICLLKIGMKPAQIAKVMDAKIQTVWNRVKRAEEICGDLLAMP